MKTIQTKHFLIAIIVIFSVVVCWPSSNKKDQGLIDAAQNGTIDEVKEWLRKGGDVNAKSHGGISGSTALHEAAGRGSTEIVELLIAEGANVDAADDMGYTPVFRAGTRESVEALIAGGADLAAKNLDGDTVLEWSDKEGFDWKSKFLRRHEAKTSGDLQSK